MQLQCNQKINQDESQIYLESLSKKFKLTQICNNSNAVRTFSQKKENRIS